MGLNLIDIEDDATSSSAMEKVRQKGGKRLILLV